MVPCYVTNVDPDWSIIMASSNILLEHEVMIAPLLFRKDKARLLLSNPTSVPKVIYKDQKLTEAIPVLELPDGTIIEPPQRF
ncbi:hypothetical protein Y032_0089g2298 [Ancylostoma ceylanicum]|uniref:Uncharacterized protein n=1 Tax=Ancylostoma ceylanicum TaxID=53326 RepID=A0A016TNE2_9BILA|nr:hypothetical protein Y032_0089g2298 [Ancylostoma ceylanicum]